MYTSKIILILMMLFSFNVSAFDTFDADWPERKPGQDYHILRITIDDCETRFIIKNEDFYDATKKEEAMNDSVDKAIKRYDRGCQSPPF